MRRVHTAECDMIHMKAGETRSRAVEHDRRQVNGDYAAPGRVLHRAQARPDAHLQDQFTVGRRQARHRPPAARGERCTVDHIVDWRQPLVDDLDRSLRHAL